MDIRRYYKLLDHNPGNYVQDVYYTHTVYSALIQDRFGHLCSFFYSHKGAVPTENTTWRKYINKLQMKKLLKIELKTKFDYRVTSTGSD